MKIYLNQNVFDAALDRIRWLYDEFEHVVVFTSGGKDSTVILNLALIVAEEKGRLPVKAMFIDQEAEWQATIDMMRIINADPRIDLDWLQVPLKLFNSTSPQHPWLYCWEEGVEWIRKKEEDSIHVNIFGSDRFKALFGEYQKTMYSETPCCALGGVRSEESPNRTFAVTGSLAYKDATWGKANNKRLGHYTMYPIYDWHWQDVWKAIHDNAWAYSIHYDRQYQYGVTVRDMRVSNVHHETAVKNLFMVQEFEPGTWGKLTKRLEGINTAGMLQRDFFFADLPFMFNGWEEYRDYLLKHLIEDEEHRSKFANKFINDEKRYQSGEFALMKDKSRLYKAEIQSLLLNDWHFTTLDNFYTSVKVIVRLRVPINE